MMDLSDGLARDLGRMCRASQVSALVQPDQLPAGPSLAHVSDPVPSQVAFGEDYQLLFTASEDATSHIEALASEYRVQVTDIGCTMQPEGAPLACLAGRQWPTPDWSHFSGRQP